jgi:hypothetical protein
MTAGALDCVDESAREYLLGVFPEDMAASVPGESSAEFGFGNHSA